MTYVDLLQHLESLQEKRIVLGLDRVRAVCARLGNPQHAIPCVHLAGTNGKGSTAIFLATLLQSAGLRVGVYTSPHLIDFVERFVVHGEPCSQAVLAECATTVRNAAPDIELTYFEFATVLAFVVFATRTPDVVIYETGLGGRLDATNVVQPCVVGLTHIDFDHCEILGDTLTQIAQEKCGICKPRVPVVSVAQHTDVQREILARAQTLHAPVQWSAPYQGALSLPGTHQQHNAGLALALAAHVTSAVVQPGAMQHTQWPGRCEWLSHAPAVLFDGAHNPAGAQALAQVIRAVRGHRRVVCAFGPQSHKDVQGMRAQLAPVVDAWVDVTTQHNTLADFAAQLTPQTVGVVTGSLYLYRAARTLFAA